ncbi:MAG: immunoglobulin domain-containing protein [Bacteroidota bacterium]
MKRFLLSFITAFALIPSLAQQSERPESGCAGGVIPVMVMEVPETQSICPGNEVSFTAYALNVSNRTWEMSTDSGLNWFPSIGILRSAINDHTYYDTLTIPVVYNEMRGYMFRCTYYGCGGSFYRTPVAILTTYGNPVQVISQPANIIACVGNAADFSISIDGGSLSYQWQQSTDAGASFQDISGEDAGVLHFNAVTAGMNGYRFRCNVTSECGGSITSDAVLLTVNIGNTSITNQPQNAIVCDGDTALFSVAASGSNVQYQWQSRTYPGNTHSDIPGTGTSTLSIPNLVEGTYYRCKITSNCITIFSQEVYASYSVDPEFNSDQIMFACEGDVVYISGIATNEQQNYQWMASSDSGITYSDMPGETSSEIIVTASSLNNGNRYKCLVSNPCFSGYSNITTLYSNPVQISIPYQPTEQIGCVGIPTSLFLYGTGPVENYVWEISYNGGNSFTNIPFADNIHWGSSTPNLGIIPATPGVYQYRCKLYGRCSPDIYSDTIVFSVFTKPNLPEDTSLYVPCDTCTMNLLSAFDTTGIRKVDLYVVQDNFSTAFVTANPDSVGIGRYRLITENTAGCRAVSNILVGIRKFDTLKVCPITAATFISSISGNSYQWQINSSVGNGFEDVANFTAGVSYDYVYGATTNTLNIHEVRSPSLIRCKVDGNSYSTTFFVSLPTYWTGAVSNAWEDPMNWTCGTPGATSDVYIPNNVSRLPQINSNNIYCRSLTVAEGASVTIKSGMNVYVNDYFQY